METNLLINVCATGTECVTAPTKCCALLGDSRHCQQFGMLFRPHTRHPECRAAEYAAFAQSREIAALRAEILRLKCEREENPDDPA